MQNSIKNKTGDYTVLKNAQNLANGKLNPNILAPTVWKDITGKIWTLDNRRLAAFRLSNLPKMPINWATSDEVAKQMWKMTTKTEGESIIIKLENGLKQIIR